MLREKTLHTQYEVNINLIYKNGVCDESVTSMCVCVCVVAAFSPQVTVDVCFVGVPFRRTA